MDNAGGLWGRSQASTNAIYHFSGGVWSAIPGAAYEVSAGAGGDVWAIGTNQVNAFGHGIYQYVGAPNYWQAINGAADHLAVAPDHSVWVLQTNGDIYRYAVGVFTATPGPGAADHCGLRRHSLRRRHQRGPRRLRLYRYVGAPNYWQAINGGAVQIAGGGANEFWVHQGGGVPAVPNRLSSIVSVPGASIGPAPTPTAVKPTPTPLPKTPVAPPTATPFPGNRLPTSPTPTPKSKASIAITPAPPGKPAAGNNRLR